MEQLAIIVYESEMEDRRNRVTRWLQRVKSGQCKVTGTERCEGGMHGQTTVKGLIL